jgi:hypothetical protein
MPLLDFFDAIKFTADDLLKTQMYVQLQREIKLVMRG